MRKLVFVFFIITALQGMVFAASPSDSNSIVIVFKDGRRQTFSMSDIARIEFSAPTASTAGSWPAHFVGKWKVGDGMGGTFFITLKRNGEARKTTGAGHGTWTAEAGEARVTWDDGWRDVIRKAGDGYEKAAFEPGKTFSDSPSNVAEAINTEPI